MQVYRIIGKELRKVAHPGTSSALTGRKVELKKAEVGLVGGTSGEPALATIFSGGRGVGKTAMLDQYTIIVRNHITKTWGFGLAKKASEQALKRPMRKASVAGSVISSAESNAGSVPFVVLYISAELSEKDIGPWAVFFETLLTVSESYYNSDKSKKISDLGGQSGSLLVGLGSEYNLLQTPAYSTMNIAQSSPQANEGRSRGRKGSTGAAKLMEHVRRLEVKGQEVKRKQANSTHRSSAPVALAKLAMVRNASFIKEKGEDNDPESSPEARTFRRPSQTIQAQRRGSGTGSIHESVHEFNEEDLAELSPNYVEFAKRQCVQEADDAKIRRNSLRGLVKADQSQPQSIGQAIAQARAGDVRGSWFRPPSLPPSLLPSLPSSFLPPFLPSIFLFLLSLTFLLSVLLPSPFSTLAPIQHRH